MKTSLPPVWGASGVQGFFGEGYWYQKLCTRFIPGYSFKGIMFVAKTATADPTVGNMLLAIDGVSPKEKRPACIVVGFWQILWGVMLNSVGLSNIGIEALIRKGLWQNIFEPFMISVMAVGKTQGERISEIVKITEHLAEIVPILQAPLAVQLNISCPNTKHKVTKDEFVREVIAFLSILDSLGVPIFVKVNVLADIEDVRKIAHHPACSGIIVSNTLPWDAVPKWMRYLFFGSATSPLAHIGGGGLSGWPLRRRVCKWIRAARKAGIKKHINAGGGIFGPFGVWSAYQAGADSISLGSIAAVRPWMLGPTATFAHWLFRKHNVRKEKLP